MNTDYFDALNIFDEFEKLKSKDPDKVLLSDGPEETDLTVIQVDDISSRVYRYLKEQNIGKEDMVNIFLPRGCSVITCLFGVWKAGAAAVILENDYPKERVDFIRKDSNCKMVIDQGTWEIILKTDPLYGHEPLDRNAAAFAVYTSGTTGNPKGVLHEYGKIAFCYLTTHWDGEPVFRGDDVFPLFFPLNFVPAVMIVPFMLVNGLKVMVIPDNVRKDPNHLRQFFIEHRVSSAYFSPSLFRSISDFGPYLRSVYTCSEPANGIWRDPEDIRVLNGYASSETASTVTFALLDKPYEIAPIGTPTTDIKVFIVDEDGKEVSPGEAGELCCEMPYTRGYINLPEQNARTFIDGIYHTGDLARKGPDGNYYLIGRIKDTVSINGKRVEPTEVEAVIRKVTGIDRVAVCSFTGGSRSYLCAYHLGDTDIDINELKKRMRDHVPYYMIPAFFIKLDEFPENANGKLDRKALPIPSAADYLTDYVSPSNDIEKAICEAMQRVLSIPRIGINDDFFRLGGDSLLLMKLIGDLQFKGLKVEDIFSGKTPKQIAKIYKKKAAYKAADIDEKQRESTGSREISMQAPLNAMQLFYAVRNEKAPDSTMMNLPIRLNLQKDADLERLAAAIRKAFQAHPAIYSVVLKNEKGEYIQRYTPQMDREIPVEKVTDQELEKAAEEFAKPFTLDGRPLVRCRILKGQTKTTVLMDIAHIVIDGEGLLLLINDICRAYAGESLRKDYWYELLGELHSAEHRALKERDMEYIRHLYDKGGVGLPNADHPMSAITYGEIYRDFPFDREAVSDISRRYGLGQNGFYIASVALALAMYNEAEDVFFEWLWNGRFDARVMQSVGMLYQEMPVFFHIGKDLDILHLLEDVSRQIMLNFTHSNVDDWGEQLTHYARDIVCVIYQGDLYGHQSNGVIRGFEPLPNETGASENSLDVEILDDRESFGVLLNYNASMYEGESMQRFARIICEMGEKIIAAAGT